MMNQKILIAVLATTLLASVGCGKKKSNRSQRPAQTAPEVAPPAPSTPAPAERTDGGEGEYSDEELESFFNSQRNQTDDQEIIVQGQGDDRSKGPIILEPKSPYDSENAMNEKYPTIEKDKLYGEDTPVYQGERSGEFGALLFDDPRWFPGLPDYPAGHPKSRLTKIFTGGVSSLGRPGESFKFTDGKSDSQMAYLVREFNEIGPVSTPNNDRVTFHKDIKAESLKLAQRISDVRLDIDKYTAGMAKIEIEFIDGPRNQPVRIFLQGMLSAGRKVELQQVDIKGDKDLKFTGVLFCRDTDGGCQNAIIQLTQYKKKEVCRTAYIVHRFGDAHITMSEQDRIRYEIQENPNHKFIAEYLSNSAYNACQVNKKRSDIPSRLTNHFLAYCGDGNYMKLPSAKSIGFKTWAAAYGASQFRIILKDNDHWTGLPAGPATVIYGPLVYAENNSPIYTKALQLSGTHAPYIKSAHLVNNDGGGNLNIMLRFASPNESELRFSVTGLIRNTGEVQKVEISREPRG